MENNETIVIDLAEYAKEQKKPPKGAKYKFQVKNKVYEVNVEEMTGREICELAGLIPPENYKLDMKLHGGIYEEIKPDQIVSFLKPGIEKFTYISRDQTEG
jgi:hypothetical protein